MGNKKRKQDSDSEEDAYHSAPDSNAPKKATTSKAIGESKARSRPKTAKKPKFGGSEDESSPVRELDNQSAVEVLKNADGEKYVNLGNKKRASVRSFKGRVYVDIREYYGTGGDEKPGKKGISLAMEQWETLKQCIGTIDSLLAEQDKK